MGLFDISQLLLQNGPIDDLHAGAVAVIIGHHNKSTEANKEFAAEFVLNVMVG